MHNNTCFYRSSTKSLLIFQVLRQHRSVLLCAVVLYPRSASLSVAAMSHLKGFLSSYSISPVDWHKLDMKHVGEQLEEFYLSYTH